MQIIKSFQIDKESKLQIVAEDASLEESISWLESIGFRIFRINYCGGRVIITGQDATWYKKFLYNPERKMLFNWEYDSFDLEAMAKEG